MPNWSVNIPLWVSCFKGVLIVQPRMGVGGRCWREFSFREENAPRLEGRVVRSYTGMVFKMSVNLTSKK